MRRSIGETINRLKALAQRNAEAISASHDSPLEALSGFGSNPGELKAWSFVPAVAAAPMPLVVILHGCTQNAAGYDHGSGWSTLAEQHGFALLFPEQTRSNNPNLCFTWFTHDDNQRDQGEAHSIRQMIGAMVERRAIDPARIFVTGLSAGGAMTSTMLATYPELFAGGAIIAGLPYGAAQGVPQAFERMRGQGLPDSAAAAALVRRASSHRGPWPTIAVWHGTADATVNEANADAIIGQWRPLHGVPAKPDATGQVDGFPHREWRDESGRTLIEDYRITGMGHGTPLHVAGEDGLGAAIPHMLDVGISSTRLIAERWGLLSSAAGRVAERTTARAEPEPSPAAPSFAHAARKRPLLPAAASGVQATIESALRSAGLMR